MTALLDWILTSVHSVNWLTRDLVAAMAILFETTIGLGLIVPGDTVAVSYTHLTLPTICSV